MQLVAEELGVPLDRVRLIQCDTAMTPDQGTTSGQQSHPTNFNQANLALAARDGARGADAARRRRSSAHPVDSARRQRRRRQRARRRRREECHYGELVGGKKFNVPLNPTAKRKTPREWTVLGTPVPRVDMPAMATGQFEFVHNVRVPGMLHGRVVRPPAVGATVVERRRELGSRHAGSRQGRRQEQLRRRGRREAVAGDAGGRAS